MNTESDGAVRDTYEGSESESLLDLDSPNPESPTSADERNLEDGISRSNSMEGNPSSMQPVASADVDTLGIAIGSDNPQPSTSTGFTTPTNTVDNGVNNGRSVARFRTIVDENGDVSYVFESDIESSEDSEDEDYLPGGGPRIFNLSLQPGIASSLNRRARLRSSSSSSVVPLEQANTPGTSRALVSANVTTGPRRRNTTGTRSRKTKVKRLKKRRKIGRKRKPKKIKEKPARIAIPLAPKVIRSQVSVYTTAEEKSYQSLSSSSAYRFSISVCSPDKDEPGEAQDYEYFVGNCELRVVGPEPVVLPSFTAETLSAAISGIQQITLYISAEENKSLLCIQVEEKLSDAESEEKKLAYGLTGRELERKYYFISMKKLYFQIDASGIPLEVFGGLSVKKLFRLCISAYNEDTKLLQLRAMLLNSAIYSEHGIYPTYANRRGLIAEAVQYFFNVNKIESHSQDQTLMQGKEDIAWFYGQIKKYHRQEVLPSVSLADDKGLIPILRDYQKDAVKWMLCRERGFANNVNLVQMFLNKMFVPIDLTSHGYDDHSKDHSETKTVWYCPYFGTFAWNIPSIPPLPSGGILCDEMGLGKTVEVLSLVTLNQLEDADDCKASLKCEVMNESEDEAMSSGAEFELMLAGKRKKKRRGRKKEKSPGPDSNVTLETGTKRQFLSPKKRSRRNVSPCEFETIETPNAPEMTSKTESVLESVVSVCVVDVETEKRIKKKRHRNSERNSEQPEVPEPKKPKRTYDRAKLIYDNELSHYAESRNAHLIERFKGEFFNPNIAPKMCFECICGEGQEDNQKYAVTCKICMCSQHADCVGFDLCSAEEHYMCPHCTTSQLPKNIKATLIVTPATISHQWIQEIQKHVKSANLKIFFYKGVSEQGYIPPSTLAAYDVIITTYNVLTNELNYVDIPHASTGGRQFRFPKRYVPIPSPLLSVHFWRICLDEAQMVEGSTTKVASMALRLHSTHRWCVTGTPMNKGLEDLFGLFAFLDVQPINIEFWWNTFVSKSFYSKENTETLFEVFGQLIWRTCKSDVLHQLGIPPQTEVSHWLTFSPLETHFYQRQFEICSEKIMEKVNDKKFNNDECDKEDSILNKKLAQLDRNTLNGFLQPFLMLRQACVHPQMVKGNWISLNKVKGTLTMEDLLDQLIKKSSIQCAEDNRVAVSSLNAMAGLYIIRENYVEAVKMYREVLQREAKYLDKFKTDSLQMIHTLENLADILDRNHPGVGFTLRDDKLRSDANELKQKYLEGYATEVTAARKVINPVTLTIRNLENKLMGRSESWWVATLSRVAELCLESTLINRIKDDLSIKSSKKKQVGSMIYLFSDFNGLQNVLVGRILEIEALRNSVLLSLTELGKLDPHSLVEGAVSCHLRKQGGQNSGANYYNESIGGYKCTLCSYHDQFLQYESVLFAEEKTAVITRTGRNYQKFKLGGRTVGQLTGEELDMVLLQEQEELAETTEHAALKGILRHGTWGPSESERVLKVIHGFARLYGMSQRVVEDGSNHIKLFEASKKEFKINRILWRKIYDQVSALDELDQATTRLRLATPAELKKSNIDPAAATSSTSGSSRRKTKVPTSLQNQLRYTQESDEKIQTIHILKPHEIEPKMHQAQSELVESEHQLAVHLGQVMYLETLKKSGYGRKGATNPDDCPICTSPLGYEWCVLTCGHSFCSECVKKMCPNPAHSLQCPVCRLTMKYVDISFVDTKEEEPSPGPGTTTTGLAEPQPSTSKGHLSDYTLANVPLPREVIGSHSSKIGSIVETLLKLETAHPGEKVIIFSSWAEVLDIIFRALEQNGIKSSLMGTGKKFQKTLDAFRAGVGTQVLLMPMASGSKGLNIIEATHVFLVEPTLNLANEQQAIGRVHRIGQTKPTFVHRFYVKNTIEEQLYDITRTQDITSDDEGSLTVADLKNLVSIRR